MIQIGMTVSELTLEYPLMEDDSGLQPPPTITLTGPVDGEESRITVKFQDTDADHGEFRHNAGIGEKYRYDATFYLKSDRAKQIYRTFCDRRDDSHVTAVYQVENLESAVPHSLLYHVVAN